MDRDQAVILLFMGGYFIYEVWRVRRDRRLGYVTSHGHPIKDSVLLFVSGVILACGLGVLTSMATLLGVRKECSRVKCIMRWIYYSSYLLLD